MSTLPERRSAGASQGRRVPLPWPKDRRFRILSIDGGGIKGILPATVLSELESRYIGGSPIGHYFDLVAGTSTGGILALGLGLGLTAQRILDLYCEAGARIFPDRHVIRSRGILGGIRRAVRIWRDLKGYRYERGPLADALQAAFGNRLLGESQVRLAVPSFDGYGEVTVFKTPHHPDYQKDWAERAVDIALATSAAPTFFSTFRNGGRQFADGGVWADNPVMIGLVDALACYDVQRDQIDILSLGCAEGEFRITQEQELHGGMWHWREIISAAIRLQSQNAWGQAGLLIGRDKILRIDRIPTETPIAMDDYRRSSTELPPLGKALVDEHGDEIAQRFLHAPAIPFTAYHGPRS